MQRYVKIAFAYFAVLIILIGGITRFHHHIDGAEICFCTNVFADTFGDNGHHADDCSGHKSSDTDKSDDTCPLRLDSFIITDSHHHNTHLFCCHQHCDLCNPLAYSDYGNDRIFFTLYAPDVTLCQVAGYGSVLKHRGPPLC